MYKYTQYNREERNLCAHLFRLLLSDNPNYGPLKEFVGDAELTRPRVFSEVALIRDAYFVRKPDVRDLLDHLCSLIAAQESLTDYRSFSQLPDILNDPSKTHPRQIRAKARKKNVALNQSEDRLYGSFQGMFNAKPDLVVCYGNKLLIYEVKYTLKFDAEQLARTRNIGEVWQKLLYKDLEFDEQPETRILTLGLEKFEPYVSWQRVLSIARNYLKEGDLSLQAFQNAVVVNS